MIGDEHQNDLRPWPVRARFVEARRALRNFRIIGLGRLLLAQARARIVADEAHTDPVKLAGSKPLEVGEESGTRLIPGLACICFRDGLKGDGLDGSDSHDAQRAADLAAGLDARFGPAAEGEGDVSLTDSLDCRRFEQHLTS